MTDTAAQHHDPADTFPRQYARTRRFTLGAPRSFQVSPDGSRVVFLRSRHGSDPVTCLWVLDGGTGTERLVADPAALGEADAELDPAEKARRERAREQAGGIVGYATDKEMRLAAFVLGGRVYIADLARTGEQPPRLLAHCRQPAADPRPDPAGQWLAYLHDGALRIAALTGAQERELIGPGSAPDLAFGVAEFIAAEEMGRTRGYWWAPDGDALLVSRVDESPVQRWYIADPASPGTPAAEVRYPAAGTANADVSLLVVRLGGRTTGVDWDRTAFPYLVTACWEAGGPPLIVVQSRDQRQMRLLEADPETGLTRLIRADTDPRWLEIVPGVPARTGDGRIVWTADTAGTRRLVAGSAAELADGSARPVTPEGLQVREILSVDGDTVLFAASAAEPTEIGVYRCRADGTSEISGPPGVHGGTYAGGTTVLASRTMESADVSVRVLRDGSQAAAIASHAERPLVPAPRPAFLRAGERELRTAVLLPSWHRPGSAKLPVLMAPYGGPHAQMVLASQAMYLTAQWFAEQGFAVVVADGRGTPGRGPAWERTVAFDFTGPVLEDQVEALHAAGREHPDLDLDRVGIRGWSFGGYLAALAVLRRPDVFHAAVAGAPVTDLRLYDTHYTERYLGHPDQHPDVYERNSLIGDAPKLTRPLLIIHGLADDNVVVAHTLRLSAALLAAGRPHAVLPLTGVTHMASQEEVAENLLLLQVDFLRRSLGVA
jgi:dipeptidyl-peptidase-4